MFSDVRALCRTLLRSRRPIRCCGCARAGGHLPQSSGGMTKALSELPAAPVCGQSLCGNSGFRRGFDVPDKRELPSIPSAIPRSGTRPRSRAGSELCNSQTAPHAGTARRERLKFTEKPLFAGSFTPGICSFAHFKAPLSLGRVLVNALRRRSGFYCQSGVWAWEFGLVFFRSMST